MLKRSAFINFIAVKTVRSRITHERSATKEPLIFQRDTASQLALRLTMRRIAITLAVVVALLFSAGSAWADWDDGLAAYVRGDYATALQEWRALAEQGDAQAQHNLGFIYGTGAGVPVSDAEAVKWYRKAAEQGYASAQFNLGLMYRLGTGVPKNDAEAVKWYRKAAEQGDAQAQHNLGVMYDEGYGAPVNDAEAVKWYRKAAEQGVAGAQVNLGYMYGTGAGVPMNYVNAYMWYSFAKAQGNEMAADNLDIVQKQMTPAQIAEAQTLATRWWKRINN